MGMPPSLHIQRVDIIYPAPFFLLVWLLHLLKVRILSIRRSCPQTL